MIREAIAKLTKKEDLTYEEARGVMEEMTVLQRRHRWEDF